MSSERRVPNFRAKVYQLQSDSNWEDMGTGNCIYEMGVEGDPDMLVVQSEENGRYILNSEVITGRFFQKQQETLIVWTDYTGKDLALSFQDSLGCDKIWQYIGEGRANIGEHMQPLIQIQTTNGLIPLYDLQLSTLKETAEVILSFLPEEREKMISFIISSDCVNKLVKLFQSIDLKDPSSQMDTQNMFNLIFALMSLQERRIIDTITQSQNIYTIIYILERKSIYLFLL
ncbi:hypothetical protein EDC96DRAFT_580080 [Choanephora cucurbitarum]|nr:hypothetical protein EDC96DRAFT_580080 [Choanephora cucurbitarum]